MEYLLFTYPGCEKCAIFKTRLKEFPLVGTEVDLARREGKARLREFLSYVHRDEKGAIKLPIFILLNGNKVEASLSSIEELEAWWKSRG